MLLQAGPETRTTPMPPLPGAVAIAAIVSEAGPNVDHALAGLFLAWPMVRLICHCCAIDSTLLTSQ